MFLSQTVKGEGCWGGGGSLCKWRRAATVPVFRRVVLPVLVALILLLYGKPTFIFYVIFGQVLFEPLFSPKIDDFCRPY